MTSGQQFVDEAEKFKGDPYVFGAAGPNSFDCSGLVQYALEQLGIGNVPRTSEAQWSWSKHISESQLQPGDLIFEQWPGDQSPPGHVVIYAGSGMVVEAPHTGANVQVRPWSPNETKIIGYGQPPGIDGTASAASLTSSISGLSITDPSTWLPSILGSMIGSLEHPIADLLERGALILFGAILILVGIWRVTSISQTPVGQKVEEVAPLAVMAA